MYCGDTVIHVVCIVGHSYTCRMYCGIQLYMSYVLWDTVIHVVCIVGRVIHVGYRYTSSMYWWDTVIHDVCIVGI